MCRGERQTLQGKSPKLSRISHTISGKLDELPTKRIKKKGRRPKPKPKLRFTIGGLLTQA